MYENLGLYLLVVATLELIEPKPETDQEKITESE